MTPARPDHVDEQARPIREVGRDTAAGITPWPLRGRSWGILFAAYVMLSGAGLALGFAITGGLASGALGTVDHQVALWFADQRTTTLDRLSDWTSMLSDTYVIIAALLGLTVLFVWMGRRWGEALVLDVALALEASVFLTVSLTVGRERPPVEQLQPAPPTASFPSGHMGAAVAFYAGLVLLVWRNSRSPLITASVALVAGLAIVSVGLSRMYLGMHFLSDVMAGVVLGAACLWISIRVVRTGIERYGDRREEIV